MEMKILLVLLAFHWSSDVNAITLWRPFIKILLQLPSYDIEKFIDSIDENHSCGTNVQETTYEVENAYEEFQRLTYNTFAFTKDESYNFKDLLSEPDLWIDSSRPPCKRDFPKYTDFKIAEIVEIAKNLTCLNESESDSGNSISSYGSVPLRKHHPLRRRRDVEYGDDEEEYEKKGYYLNSDGSITKLRGCFRKGTLTPNGHLRLVSECVATTILPDNRYPRYINEVICHPKDYLCFSNEGVAAQHRTFLNFKRDDNEYGKERLQDWNNYIQPIRTSCSCEISTKSVLGFFI